MAGKRQPGLEPVCVVGVLGSKGISLSFVSWFVFPRMGVEARGGDERKDLGRPWIVFVSTESDSPVESVLLLPDQLGGHGCVTFTVLSHEAEVTWSV